MNSASSNLKFRKTLFWVTSIFFVVHIVLSSLSIFYTIDFLPGKLKSFYKKLLVIGPFFIDKRITTSPHLYVSYSSPTGDWFPLQDMAQVNVLLFQQNPWRYDTLKWSYYERYVCRKAYPEIRSLKYIDGSEGKSILELIKYVMLQHPQSDSVRLLYIWNVWQPDTQSIKSDTAFNVVFKPKKSGVTE